MASNFENREYVFERMGWLSMLVLMIAAGLGLFGKGILSEQTVVRPGFTLHYERFLHAATTTRLSLAVELDESDDLPIMISFSNAYLHQFQMVRMVPEPESMAAGDRTVFWFSIIKSHHTASIEVHLEPDSIGPVTGSIQVGDLEPVAFTQFVYP